MDQGKLEAARRLIEQAELLFERALAQDEDHIEALQSFPVLLILEARRLRQMGNDPTAVLDRAGRLIELAFAVDEVEITTSLAEVRWLLERALTARAARQDAETVVMEGRRCIAEVLQRVPEAPEALQLDQWFVAIQKDASRGSL